MKRHGEGETAEKKHAGQGQSDMHPALACDLREGTTEHPAGVVLDAHADPPAHANEEVQC